MGREDEIYMQNHEANLILFSITVKMMHLKQEKKRSIKKDASVRFITIEMIQPVIFHNS